jgi:hypothetical protein
MIRIMADNNTNKILGADVTSMEYENYTTVRTGGSTYVYYYINTDDIIKAINHVKLFLRIE